MDEEIHLHGPPTDKVKTGHLTDTLLHAILYPLSRLLVWSVVLRKKGVAALYLSIFSGGCLLGQTVKLRDAIAYVLSRLGCTHPFRLSRVLALAELKHLEREGARLTDAKYVGGPGVFYIEGVKELTETDQCFYRIEGDPGRGVRGCLGYRCGQPKLPEKAKAYLDEAIELSKNLEDVELNRMVVSHPLYKKLVGE